MKIWILGAGGLVGGAVVDYCQAMGIPFVASKHKQVDITDLESLREAAKTNRATHIINCAAYTDVDGAEKDPATAFAVNAKGPENLGLLAKEFSLKVVHISTDYVFDGTSDIPYTETDVPNPLGVYGKSKYEGEKRLLQNLPSACIVRTSWVFGPRGKNFISNVLPHLSREDGIHAVTDQVNRATYYKDLAKVLIDLSCHSGIFHFANGHPISRYEIVQDFYQEAKTRGIPLKCQKITPISSIDFPAKSPRPKYSVLSTDKIEGVLGRKPRLWKTVLGDYFDLANTHI